MSYELKGKLIWGTPVFRIHCELESKRFGKEFKGSLTLLERRHEVSTNKFSSLEQFIVVLRNLWSSSLRVSAIQDTRLARWIEEYLPELGLHVAYSDILDATKGRYEETPPIEVEDEVILTADDIRKIVPEASDPTITGVTRTLKGAIEDHEALERILDKFIIEYKASRTQSATSKFKYESDGKTKTDDLVFTFDFSPIKNEISLITTYMNSKPRAITGIEITECIPADYGVISKKNLTGSVEKVSEEEKHEGLVIVWKLAQLGPNEEVKIEYKLNQKMLRTIIVRDDNDLNILQLQDDIHFEGKDIWIDSSYTFHDKTPIIEDVKVLDQIPRDLKVVRGQPEIAPPRAKLVETPHGTEIIWSFTNVTALTQMKIEYELTQAPKMYRDIITIVDKNDNPVADVVKIIKSLKNGEGWGVVYGVKSINSSELNLYIEDKFPSIFEVNSIHSDDGEVVKQENGNNVSIKWSIDNPPNGKEIMTYFKLVGKIENELDLTHFNVGSSSANISKEKSSETRMEREEIIMPDVYYYEVDT
ncbi:MAG: hypothetical protein GPJ54_18750 [Candidatus Heimdallarchaeota archaeon]|nr:hypothetical protein [Candidatus Heimdallarchaeota archaeon]